VEVKRNAIRPFIGESEGNDYRKIPGIGESMLLKWVLRG
jgi:hypothetical protein